MMHSFFVPTFFRSPSHGPLLAGPLPGRMPAQRARARADLPPAGAHDARRVRGVLPVVWSVSLRRLSRTVAEPILKHTLDPARIPLPPLDRRRNRRDLPHLPPRLPVCLRPSLLRRRPRPLGSLSRRRASLAVLQLGDVPRVLLLRQAKLPRALVTPLQRRVCCPAQK